MRGKNFDGYLAPQPRIASAIHFAHATGAQRRLNFIWSEFCASSKPHDWLELYARNQRVDSARPTTPWLFFLVPLYPSSSIRLAGKVPAARYQLLCAPSPSDTRGCQNPQARSGDEKLQSRFPA